MRTIENALSGNSFYPVKINNIHKDQDKQSVSTLPAKKEKGLTAQRLRPSL
jgi:hypothetical protein